MFNVQTINCMQYSDYNRLKFQNQTRSQITQWNRVLKWWRHKKEISEIMGFVRIFWKNNVQEAYLPKMNISGQIVSEMLAGYPSNLFLGRPKKN